jgi:hypothetical protein
MKRLYKLLVLCYILSTTKEVSMVEEKRLEYVARFDGHCIEPWSFTEVSDEAAIAKVQALAQQRKLTLLRLWRGKKRVYPKNARRTSVRQTGVRA